MPPISTETTLTTLKPKRCKKSDSKFVHTVDLHYRNLESAKNIVIETIQEFHSTEISRIRFITGRGNHVNSNGERAILYNNFPKWMVDITIVHLIESYEQGNGNYLVILNLKSYHIPVHAVELKNLYDLQSAKSLTIRTIQECHSKEILIIKFIMGKSKKFYKNFPQWISNIAINHLIKSYVPYDEYYYLSLKSSDQLEREVTDTFFDIDAIRQCALDGDVEAQYMMGLMYHDGEGVKKDIQESLKWLGQSAENGKVEAGLLVERLKLELEN